MWTLGAALGLSSSTLTLSNDEEATLRRRSATLALERRIGDRWAVQIGAGASLGGDISVGADRYELDVGWLASIGGSYRVLDGDGLLPFFLTSLSLGVGSAQARDGDEAAALTAIDARVAATVGKMFWDFLGPYAVARVFGGPVLWERGGEDVTGSDRYHVQLGAGLLLARPGVVSAFFELVPLGEQTVTTGLAASF
jgi:hypothetical protein